ncbi:hypothetical protein HDU76_005762 [Blyttiomyces sp. JEL0837]|nr:hypothetical protein HDU76_005762 [Blyttiomyces sp. JEL0837]
MYCSLNKHPIDKKNYHDLSQDDANFLMNLGLPTPVEGGSEKDLLTYFGVRAIRSENPYQTGTKRRNILSLGELSTFEYRNKLESLGRQTYFASWSSGFYHQHYEIGNSVVVERRVDTTRSRNAMAKKVAETRRLKKMGIKPARDWEVEAEKIPDRILYYNRYRSYREVVRAIIYLVAGGVTAGVAVVIVVLPILIAFKAAIQKTTQLQIGQATNPNRTVAAPAPLFQTTTTDSTTQTTCSTSASAASNLVGTMVGTILIVLSSFIAKWRNNVSDTGVLPYLAQLGKPRMEEVMFSYRWQRGIMEDVRSLAIALRASGIRVWIDVMRNQEFTSGDRTPEVSRSAVHYARFCVVFLTREYLQSQACFIEFREMMSSPDIADRIIVYVVNDTRDMDLSDPNVYNALLEKNEEELSPREVELRKLAGLVDLKSLGDRRIRIPKCLRPLLATAGFSSSRKKPFRWVGGTWERVGTVSEDHSRTKISFFYPSQIAKRIKSLTKLNYYKPRALQPKKKVGPMLSVTNNNSGSKDNVKGRFLHNLGFLDPAQSSKHKLGVSALDNYHASDMIIIHMFVFGSNVDKKSPQFEKIYTNSTKSQILQFQHLLKTHNTSIDRSILVAADHKERQQQVLGLFDPVVLPDGSTYRITDHLFLTEWESRPNSLAKEMLLQLGIRVRDAIKIYAQELMIEQQAVEMFNHVHKHMDM